MEACRSGRTTWGVESAADLPLTPIDEAAIADALRDALRSHGRADRLATSPLHGLAWFRVGNPHEAPATRVARRLSELVESLGDEGHDGTLRRVLSATYLSPPRKGLAIADSLGMGYSTYRRWLAQALDRLARELVLRERAARRSTP